MRTVWTRFSWFLKFWTKALVFAFQVRFGCGLWFLSSLHFYSWSWTRLPEVRAIFLSEGIRSFVQVSYLFGQESFAFNLGPSCPFQTDCSCLPPIANSFRAYSLSCLLYGCPSTLSRPNGPPVFGGSILVNHCYWPCWSKFWQSQTWTHGVVLLPLWTTHATNSYFLDCK